jgi:peptide deformylase
VLRQKAKRVSQVDRPIQKLIDDMIETMKVAPGVGLAAPQVGVPLRLAVIDVEDKITVIVNLGAGLLGSAEPRRAGVRQGA